MKTETNVNKYKINDLIFPSRIVYQNIKSIDRNLRFLYSPAPVCSTFRSTNYSLARESTSNFNAILIRVKERINRFKGKVKIIETDDSAFNEEFPGIIDFLYEASDIETKAREPLERKFVDLAKRLWDLGIRPLEF